MMHGPRPNHLRPLLVLLSLIALAGATTTPAGAHEEHEVDFNSGPLEHNETFSFTFHETGTYRYGCTVHEDEPERGIEVYLARGDAEGVIVGDIEIIIEDGAMWIETEGERRSADDVRILRSAQISWTNLDDPEVHGYHTVTFLSHEPADAYGAETPAPSAALLLGATAIGLLGLTGGRRSARY